MSGTPSGKEQLVSEVIARNTHKSSHLWGTDDDQSNGDIVLIPKNFDDGNGDDGKKVNESLFEDTDQEFPGFAKVKEEVKTNIPEEADKGGKKNVKCKTNKKDLKDFSPISKANNKSSNRNLIKNDVDMKKSHRSIIKKESKSKSKKTNSNKSRTNKFKTAGRIISRQ